MAQLVIAVFYNGTLVQSVSSAALLKTKYRAENVTIVDLAGKNEGAMTTAIGNAGSADSFDRVFCVAPTTPTYESAGYPSEGTNVDTNMEALIKSTAESPWNVPIELGLTVANEDPLMLTWENCYPTVAAPPVVRYLGGTAHFPRWTKASAASSADGVTSSGFSANAEIGNWVYITTATLGKGQIRQISANSTTKLTVSPNWTTTPTVSNSIGFEVVLYKEDAFVKQALQYALMSKLWNIANSNIMRQWYRLFDLGAYNSSYNSINDGRMAGTLYDEKYFESLVEYGKAIWEQQNQYLVENFETKLIK